MSKKLAIGQQCRSPFPWIISENAFNFYGTLGKLVRVGPWHRSLEAGGCIEELAAVNQARVIGRIPFDHVVNDALRAGKTVIEYGESRAAEAIRAIWNSLHAHGMVE